MKSIDIRRRNWLLSITVSYGALCLATFDKPRWSVGSLIAFSRAVDKWH